MERYRQERETEFQNEANLLSTLRHPNIVTFLGFLIKGGEVNFQPFDLFPLSICPAPHLVSLFELPLPCDALRVLIVTMFCVCFTMHKPRARFHTDEHVPKLPALLYRFAQPCINSSRLRWMCNLASIWTWEPVACDAVCVDGRNNASQSTKLGQIIGSTVLQDMQDHKAPNFARSWEVPCSKTCRMPGARR